MAKIYWKDVWKKRLSQVNPQNLFNLPSRKFNPQKFTAKYIMSLIEVLLKFQSLPQKEILRDSQKLLTITGSLLCLFAFLIITVSKRVRENHY